MNTIETHSCAAVWALPVWANVPNARTISCFVTLCLELFEHQIWNSFDNSVVKTVSVNRQGQ